MTPKKIFVPSHPRVSQITRNDGGTQYETPFLSFTRFTNSISLRKLILLLVFLNNESNKQSYNLFISVLFPLFKAEHSSPRITAEAMVPYLKKRPVYHVGIPKEFLSLMPDTENMISSKNQLKKDQNKQSK